MMSRKIRKEQIRLLLEREEDARRMIGQQISSVQTMQSPRLALPPPAPLPSTEYGQGDIGQLVDALAMRVHSVGDVVTGGMPMAMHQPQPGYQAQTGPSAPAAYPTPYYSTAYHAPVPIAPGGRVVYEQQFLPVGPAPAPRPAGPQPVLTLVDPPQPGRSIVR